MSPLENDKAAEAHRGTNVAYDKPVDTIYGNAVVTLYYRPMRESEIASNIIKNASM